MNFPSNPVLAVFLSRIIALSLFTFACEQPVEPAELVLLNGKILTVDEHKPEAEALAAEIATFPQLCVRADRASVYAQHGRSIEEGMRGEFAGGQLPLQEEGLAGATRFSSGSGRHGDFDDGPS